MDSIIVYFIQERATNILLEKSSLRNIPSISINNNALEIQKNVSNKKLISVMYVRIKNNKQSLQ